MCQRTAVIMSCNRPAKMLFGRIGFTAVTQSVFCAQICKQRSKSWRFCSNVSRVNRKKLDLQLSDEEIQKKFSRGRKMQWADDTDATGEVPAAFTAVPKKTNSVRLLDEVAADEIVKGVKNVFDKNNVIFDFDAGSGYLSKALLMSGMKNVVALEPHDSFCTMLEELAQIRRKSFNYFLKSIHNVIAYSDEEFSTELPNIETSKVGCDVQIIGQTPSWHLLVQISRQTRDDRSFLWGKSLNLCLCLPQEIWEQFLDSKVQRMCVVERILFQLAFDYKILTTVQKRHFYFRLKNREQMKLNRNDNMVLIHIKSKSVQDFDLSELQVFLQQFHNCSSRNRLVIPSLEHWAPSCGEELIKRGMLMFTRFSDLQPEELLEVFRYFKSLPSVKASDFLSEWKSDSRSEVRQKDYFKKF